MGVTVYPKTFPAEKMKDIPGFGSRIKVSKTGNPFPKEIPEQHQELSIIPVRKSVMSIPAVLTILGTSEALVIPGIVLTSRK